MSQSSVKLLDFWAAWCGPCKIMNPIIEELEKEYGSKIIVEKYDVDDPANQATVQKYQVMAMPTYFIEKNGQVVEQFVGAQSKSAMVVALDKALG
ncbi:MAG: thioredoxin domain-containing protein [Patescibacteria group bacterium]